MQSVAMGQAIRAARKGQRGLSRQELVDRLEHFGLSWPPQTIERIERGARSVSVVELLLIAAALNRSPDVLALPGDPHDTLQLTDTYALRIEDARDWWSGERPPPSDRVTVPAWPIEEEQQNRDYAVSEHSEWIRSRPGATQAERELLLAQPHIALLLADVGNLRQVIRSVALGERKEDLSEVYMAEAVLRLAKSARTCMEQGFDREALGNSWQAMVDEREAIHQLLADHFGLNTNEEDDDE